MDYYYLPINNKITHFTDDLEITYSDFISNDFSLFYYNNTSWLYLRPINLYYLYPNNLSIIEDNCYSGYTYEDPNFEGEYIGVSYTPTNIILFVYRQFNTGIIFQSIDAPTATFKTPSKSNNLVLETDFTNQFIGIKLNNSDDVNLLLTS